MCLGPSPLSLLPYIPVGVLPVSMMSLPTGVSVGARYTIKLHPPGVRIHQWGMDISPPACSILGGGGGGVHAQRNLFRGHPDDGDTGRGLGAVVGFIVSSFHPTPRLFDKGRVVHN